MPVYQYACTECGEQLEVRQSFTDDALTVCPVCEGRLRKVLSAVGVVFKGSGFYRTDSRAAESSSTGGGSTATKTDSSKSESTKSETSTVSASGSTESAKSSSSSSSSASSTSGSSGTSAPSKAAS